MRKLLTNIRDIKIKFAKEGYVCKNHEGKPFFGDVTITLNDGKIVYSKNKDKGEFGVVESIKL